MFFEFLESNNVQKHLSLRLYSSLRASVTLLLVLETFLIFEPCEAHLKRRGGLVPSERAQSEFYGPGNQSREFEAWLHFGVAGLVLQCQKIRRRA